MAFNKHNIVSLFIMATITTTIIFGSEDQKPGVLHTLCGTDFTRAWRNCCGNNPKCDSTNEQGNVKSVKKRGKSYRENERKEGRVRGRKGGREGGRKEGRKGGRITTKIQLYKKKNC